MKGIYIAGGYPDRGSFRKTAEAVQRCGFDFIEIGMPFNDPSADGPVISAALHDCVERGITPSQVMEDIESMEFLKIKKYIMTYANVIHSYGIKAFSDRMKGHINGLIIPDLPNRMHNYFYERGCSIPLITFVTPETREDDLDYIVSGRGDFIYLVGTRGITGAKSNTDRDELKRLISQIRKNLSLPIVLGFGIKSAGDAAMALADAGGYVIGTEAVKRQGNRKQFEEYLSMITGNRSY